MNCKSLPSDDGDLVGQTELLQSGSELAVYRLLEGNGPGLDVALLGDEGSAGLMDLNVLGDALALLIVDNGDVILLGVILKDSSGIEGAEGSSDGARTQASAGAACDSERVAGEHGGK